MIWYNINLTYIVISQGGIHPVLYLKGREPAGVGVTLVSPAPGIKQEVGSNGAPLSPGLLLFSPFSFHTKLSNTTLNQSTY